MRAIQIRAPGEAGAVDIPMPEPAPGEVVVRARAVTTCPQWDMHVLRDVPMFAGQAITYPHPPGQPGHEMAGEIAALGEGVTGFSEGDRVVAWRDPGHERQGCYAELVPFDPANLLLLPEGARFTEYASLELAMCVGASFLDILGTTSLRGKRVGVSGLGGAGLIAAQYAKAEGASEVVGFEPNAERAEFAGGLGVGRVVNPIEVPAAEFVSGGGGKLDVSLDCVGAKAAAEYLMAVTSEIVAVFGVQRQGYVFPESAGSLKLFGYPGHTREAAEYAMSKVSAGLVRLGALIGAKLALEEYVKGVEMLERQEALKVCFLPNGE